MLRFRECATVFPDIWRVFISGSSASGKTYFTQQLIESGLINFERIYYFHPDFHETDPIQWNRNDIIFSAGLPDTEFLLKIPENSCLILDDLFAEAKDSKTIDYLFRVLSSKRKLHCFIMTQRYFSNGIYTLNIRNSSNIHVLMRNADELSNFRVARSMNLKNEIDYAVKHTQNDLYPYIFINRTNYARVNSVQVFVDIFSKFKKVVMRTGPYYLISERDFKQNFSQIDENTAVKNGWTNTEKVCL